MDFAMKKIITIKDIDNWGACCREDDERYNDTRLKKLLRGRKGLTVDEVLRMRIPPEDRLWVVLREELIRPEILHEFACQCAEWILNKREREGYKIDTRSRAAIQAKRDWLLGTISDKKLDAARVAAWAAALDATRDVAWDAARVAAWAAASASVSVYDAAAYKLFILFLKRLLERS
jgi:hypothetical protein